MNDKYLNEVMHAYAAGCLDHEDLIPLLGLLDSDGNLTNPELGELQNLAGLLPAILMLENPPASAKDKIAMRLYALREEMISRKAEEQNVIPENTAQSEVLREPVKEQEAVYSPRFAVQNDLTDSGIQERVPDHSIPLKEKISSPVESYIDHKPDYAPRHQENYSALSEPVKKEGKGTLIALIVVFVILIAGASSAVYYIMKQKIETQEKTISALRSDINVINDEIIRLNKVQRILAILGSKDVNNINLDGTVDNPTGFGKIVFDPANKEGLLSLFNMPALPREKSYQLWLISKGQPFSLGLYNPQKDADRYIPISEFPDIPMDNIDAFQLTLEDAQGSDSPKGPIYLNSSVKRQNHSSYYN